MSGRGKAVIDGALQYFSPSSLAAYDPTTRFGCPRRWWFRYVDGRTEPQNPAQEKGVKLHKMNERFLLGERVEGDVGELFPAGLHYLEKLRPRVVRVEHSVEFAIDGVVGVGNVDVVTQNGIVDWKTTSDKKNMKDPNTLREDMQLALYAYALFPDGAEVTHGYYTTKGRVQFQAVDSELSREDIEKAVEKAHHLLVDMRGAAKLQSPNSLERQAPSKCGWCPHRSYCPTESEDLVLKFLAAQPAQPIPATPPTPTVAVLPPDAPESVPELAAKPVEAPTAAPERKRRLRVSASSAPAPTQAPAAQAPTAQAPTATYQVTKVTVTRSVTLQPVQFHPVRFECTLEASVTGGDPEGVYKEVSERAGKLVSDNAVAYMAEFNARQQERNKP